MVSIAISSVTATSVELAVSGTTEAATQLQVQYAPRDDFNWCVAPAPRCALDDTITLDGLNQGSRYFIRARELGEDGDAGPWSTTIAVFTPLDEAWDTSPQAIAIRPVLLIVPEPVQAWYCASEEGGHPARALGRDDPSCALWSRVSLGLYSFEATLSGAPIDTIAVLETNVGENATITVKADTSTGGLRGLTPAFSTGPLPFRASPNLPQRLGYHALVRLEEAQSYSLWRVEIAGDVPGEMLAATYAVFGRARISKNMTGGKTETPTDSSTLARGRSGTPARAGGIRGRQASLDLSLMTPAQFETQYGDLRWRVGTTDPVLLVTNSVEGGFLHDCILYGAISESKSTRPYTLRVTQSLTLDSLI